MCTKNERTERLRVLMLAAMIFGTVQQFEFLETAEPAADDDDFDSLVPEPAPERPLAGRGRTSLPEPAED